MALPDDRLDEPTGLFLSAVASPQSRLPLHPVASPYKGSNPAQVFCWIGHKISFTPPRTGDRDSDGIWWTANGGADIPVDGLTGSDTGTCTDQRATAWIRRVDVCGKLRGLECGRRRMRHLSIKLCLTMTSGAALESRLEHGIQLRQDVGDAVRGDAPATIF